ncbi:MAG: TIGR04372 family glycosyltransferase [Rhodospirillales bacterium]
MTTTLRRLFRFASPIVPSGLRTGLMNLRLWCVVVAWTGVAWTLGLLARLGKPVSLVALGGERIGTLSGIPDMLFRMRQNDLVARNTTYIILIGRPANEPLLEIVARHFPVLRAPRLYTTLINACSGSRYLQECPQIVKRDYRSYARVHHGAPDCMPPGPKAKAALSAYFDRLGIPQDSWFVCIHNRDPAYLTEAFPGQNWSHHDYRDCSISNYMAAAEHVVERGGYVFRVGNVVTTPLHADRSPQIIDTAVEERDPLLEIALISHCRMFLGCSAGIYAAATFFNRPLALCNMLPLEIATYTEHDIFIPKLLYSRTKKRLLTWSEIHSLGVFHGGEAGNADFYERNGINVIENSSQDILDLCIERLAIAELGPGAVSPEDRELQLEFKERYMSHLDGYAHMGHLSTHFLRRHFDLWDERSRRTGS